MNKVFGTGFRRVAVLLLVLMLFDASGIASALAAPPAAVGNPNKVFFADCGHYLGGRMLNYWRAHGREQWLGCPVSEEMSVDGVSFQYFQKARVEYHPENGGTPWEYAYGVIGTEIYNAMSPDERANPAYNQIAPFASTKDRQFFPETGHSVGGGFKQFWTANNGLYTFGLPLSEEYSYSENGKGYAAQDFERARMLYSPDTGVVLANIGALAAKANNIDISALTKEPFIPAFNPNLWEHWVDVNLSTQTASFMEGDQVVRKNLVTTGKPGHETPTGTYRILTRIYNEHMRGGAIGTEDYYDLDNVLFTQYFTYEGHALHYAWWRSQFGVTGSHGCVNMDYASSEFAWNWLSLGARVVIHY